MKSIMMTVALIATASTIKAQTNSDRISVGVGALYERGLDITLSYEHETKYHNAWEYFANGYIKWDECKSCGHVCPDSFWRNYRSYGFGIAYKPCVTRGRNHHGNLRIGASAEVTPRISWEAHISVMSTTIHCEEVGNSIGK